MPRKKVRYVIDESGEYREIFSIGEGSLGDLSITLRGTDSVSIDKDTLSRLVLDKISVHRSLKSVRDGTTISRTTTFEDATTIKHSAFIKSSKKLFLRHLFSMACPDLKPSRYDLSTGKTAQVIRLRAGDKPLSTLCCHVFVANKNRDIPVAQITLVHAHDFRHFRILAYTNFMNLPASHFSAFVFMPTTTMSINGVKSESGADHFNETYPGGAVNLEDKDVAHIIHCNNEILFLQLCENLRDFMIKDVGEEAAATFEQLQPLFSIFPLEGLLPMILLDPPLGPWTPPKQQQP